MLSSIPFSFGVEFVQRIDTNTSSLNDVVVVALVIFVVLVESSCLEELFHNFVENGNIYVCLLFYFTNSIGFVCKRAHTSVPAVCFSKLR